jgi:hypothetical protein
MEIDGTSVGKSIGKAIKTSVDGRAKAGPTVPRATDLVEIGEAVKGTCACGLARDLFVEGAVVFNQVPETREEAEASRVSGHFSSKAGARRGRMRRKRRDNNIKRMRRRGVEVLIAGVEVLIAGVEVLIAGVEVLIAGVEVYIDEAIEIGAFDSIEAGVGGDGTAVDVDKEEAFETAG